MSEGLMRAIAQQRDPSHTLEVIKVPAPAAGADWSFTIKGENVRRLISVTGVLATSAAVANRAPALEIAAPEGTVITVEQPAVITATLSTIVCWGAGVSGDAASLVNGRLTAGIGEYVLPPGYIVRTSTGAIDAADQWSSVLLWCETMLTQPYTTHEERAADWLAGLIHEALAAQGG